MYNHAEVITVVPTKSTLMSTAMNDMEQHEAARLKELYDLEILDTDTEKDFDDFVELASGIADTPISLITLLDTSRQWFKAYKGVDFRETPRQVAFCDVAIQQADPMVVPDALLDKRFETNPLVTGDTQIRFYAGFPLVTPSGNALGTLCVIDQKPGELSAEKVALLTKLADKVVQMLELRRKNKELARLRTEADSKRDMMNQLLANQRKMMAILAHDTKGPLVSMAHLVDMLSAMPAIDIPTKDMACGLMSSQLKVCLELIDNLLAWGGTHLSGQFYEERAYSAEQVVKESVQPLMRMAEEKQITLQLRVTPETSLWINREIIRFIVRNLVHNALKFTEQGYISVDLHNKDGRSVIKVEDTGVGMPKGTQEKLFARKVPSREGTRKEQGSGIGLILINDFVLKLEGSIHVSSQEGVGTAITLDLPHNPDSMRHA